MTATSSDRAVRPRCCPAAPGGSLANRLAVASRPRLRFAPPRAAPSASRGCASRRRAEPPPAARGAPRARAAGCFTSRAAPQRAFSATRVGRGWRSACGGGPPPPRGGMTCESSVSVFYFFIGETGEFWDGSSWSWSGTRAWRALLGRPPGLCRSLAPTPSWGCGHSPIDREGGQCVPCRSGWSALPLTLSGVLVTLEVVFRSSASPPARRPRRLPAPRGVAELPALTALSRALYRLCSRPRARFACGPSAIIAARKIVYR